MAARASFDSELVAFWLWQSVASRRAGSGAGLLAGAAAAQLVGPRSATSAFRTGPCGGRRLRRGCRARAASESHQIVRDEARAQVRLRRGEKPDEIGLSRRLQRLPSGALFAVVRRLFVIEQQRVHGVQVRFNCSDAVIHAVDGGRNSSCYGTRSAADEGAQIAVPLVRRRGVL